MTLIHRTLLAVAAALIAAPAFGQVTQQEEITQYDQPQQCDCFFLQDRVAVPGVGRSEGGELTPRQEITQYDAPAQCDCFMEQGRIVIEDPEATGTIIVRRPLSARELETLYQDGNGSD
ncbi:hypothetical protein [Salinarimonas sp.]|uniref:hypothetical protein n=1 Tax=Salinarimonas sp. TaxID=2766526 RepID=UPI0032D91FF7